MFGLGIWEFVLIVIVGLVVLGPQRLPQVARQLGRALREFRRAANELQVSLEQAADDPPKPTPPKALPYQPATDTEPAEGLPDTQPAANESEEKGDREPNSPERP